MSGSFYGWFSNRQLTGFGQSRRDRIQRVRLGQLMDVAKPPGRLLEIGPGTGGVAQIATEAGWTYTAIEASPQLAGALRARGMTVIEAWTPPFPVPDGSFDVIYADQVLEHMAGINEARQFVSEAYRALTPGGVLFVVVPDYLKEREFFWDIDYTHNFVTTDRRMQQLFFDGGFTVTRTVRSIGAATGLARALLAGLAVPLNIPGVDALARLLRLEGVLFLVRKNLFQTLTFVARRNP